MRIQDVKGFAGVLFFVSLAASVSISPAHAAGDQCDATTSGKTRLWRPSQSMSAPEASRLRELAIGSARVLGGQRWVSAPTYNFDFDEAIAHIWPNHERWELVTTLESGRLFHRMPDSGYVLIEYPDGKYFRIGYRDPQQSSTAVSQFVDWDLQLVEEGSRDGYFRLADRESTAPATVKRTEKFNSIFALKRGALIWSGLSPEEQDTILQVGPFTYGTMHFDDVLSLAAQSKDSRWIRSLDTMIDVVTNTTRVQYFRDRTPAMAKILRVRLGLMDNASRLDIWKLDRIVYGNIDTRLKILRSIQGKISTGTQLEIGLHLAAVAFSPREILEYLRIATLSADPEWLPIFAKWQREMALGLVERDHEILEHIAQSKSQILETITADVNTERAPNRRDVFRYVRMVEILRDPYDLPILEHLAKFRSFAVPDKSTPGNYIEEDWTSTVYGRNLHQRVMALITELSPAPTKK